MHRPVLIALALTVACSGEDPTDTDIDDIVPDPYDVEVGPYTADITWDAWGVPHIVAEDEGSLAYGHGYTVARDHICTLADQFVKVRSERARYFGDDPAYVESDFGWLHIGVRRHAEESWFELAPDVQARLIGYAAGYNAYLEEVGVDGLPEPCRGEEWVKPIDHIDLWSYDLSLIQWGSGYNLVNLIAQAQPPTAESGSGGAPVVPPPPMEVLEPVKNPGLGSNGWAIGRDDSSTGGGMLLSNSHFPSNGERQWHEVHLQIPGETNVYGSALIGMPIVAIGFNEHVAWTHTVSNAPRFIPYLLQMRPGDLTGYEKNGSFVDLEATTYTIDVAQPDGSTSTLSRTLYRSEYGPMWNAPVVGWGLQGMTYRDVNADNIEAFDTWLGMNRATSLDAFKEAHRAYQGIPWVHTIATDKEGTAFYTDSAATPNIPDEVWAAYDDLASNNFFVRQFAGFGLVVFDGSTDEMAWADDDRAARPGTIPFEESPQLERTDFVSNANLNHWLANPAEPLTGYNRAYGPTGTPQTPRTRMNNFYLLGQGEDPEIGEDGLWDLDELTTAALSMRSAVSELLKDDVAARCDGVGEVVVGTGDAAQTVDIGPACDTLAAWDGRGGVDSRGAHLWREFLNSGPITQGDLSDAGPLFATPFDPSDPIATPSGLAPAPADAPDPVLQGLAQAVLKLEQAGIAVDAALGDIQVRKKGDEAYAVPGGQYFEGYIGIATYSGKSGDTTLYPAIPRGEVIDDTTDLTDEGYVITNGNSWVMAMQFGPDGPEANAVMVYSQSEDPDSPHFADQTALYATQQMRPVLFTDEDLAAAEGTTTLTLTYP
jgi:acyl-homoserine-lactone acylase